MKRCSAQIRCILLVLQSMMAAIIHHNLKIKLAASNLSLSSQFKKKYIYKRNKMRG